MKRTNTRAIVFLVFIFIVLCLVSAFPQSQSTDDSGDVILPSSMWEKIKSTGFTGFVLMLVSVIGVSYALERAFNLRQDKIVPNGVLQSAQELWRTKQLDKLLENPGRHDSTFGRIIKTLVSFC